MILRQPAFWSDRRHPLGAVLTPLSWLWQLAGKLRAAVTRPYTANLNVICVGNVAVGGSGKTPTAIALAAHFKNRKVAFLTRGYGGRARGPVLIENADDAALYGDEAVLLSRYAPTIIARNRKAGLKRAEQQGFDIVIADDGLQNPSFTKNTAIIVVDGKHGLGNGRIIPAGPLRETPATAAQYAQAVLIIGKDIAGAAAAFPGLPVLHGVFVPASSADKSVPYVAFAGIGHPDKFFDTLGDHGYVLAEAIPFPDHHRYDKADLDRLHRLAARHNAKLITTEKDRVRLPAGMDVATLRVTLHIEGALDDVLK